MESEDSTEYQNELVNSHYYKLKLDDSCIVLVESKQELMKFLDEIILSKKSEFALNREDLKELIFVGVDTGTKCLFFYRKICK